MNQIHTFEPESFPESLEKVAKKQKMSDPEPAEKWIDLTGFDEDQAPAPAQVPAEPIYLNINDIVPMSCKIPKIKGAVYGGAGVIPLDHGCSLLMISNVLSSEDIKAYLNESVKLNRVSGRSGFGIKPRKELCYTPSGKSFKYAGVNHKTVNYPPHVLKAIAIMEAKTDALLIPKLGHANEFKELSSGIDIVYDKSFPLGGSICAHKDDEEDWGMILVYTLGQARILRIRSDDSKEYYNVVMQHNSLVVMYGAQFQKKFTHQVDKLSAGEPVGTRLSLNVRYKK